MDSGGSVRSLGAPAFQRDQQLRRGSGRLGQRARWFEEQASVRYPESLFICGSGERIEAQGGRPMIKLALTCDSCGSIIAWGRGANELRHKAQALHRTYRGKDLCLICGVYVPLSGPQETPGRAPVEPQGS